MLSFKKATVIVFLILALGLAIIPITNYILPSNASVTVKVIVPKTTTLTIPNTINKISYLQKNKIIIKSNEPWTLIIFKNDKFSGNIESFKQVTEIDLGNIKLEHKKRFTYTVL